jgi:hypothetical protein
MLDIASLISSETYSVFETGLFFFLLCVQQIRKSIPVNGATHIVHTKSIFGLMMAFITNPPMMIRPPIPSHFQAMTDPSRIMAHKMSWIVSLVVKVTEDRSPRNEAMPNARIKTLSVRAVQRMTFIYRKFLFYCAGLMSVHGTDFASSSREK